MMLFLQVLMLEYLLQMKLIKKIGFKRGREVGLFECGCGKEVKTYMDKDMDCCIECGSKKDFVQCPSRSYTKRKVRVKKERVSPTDRLSNVYGFMMKRCYDKNDRQYPEYGGRGIDVCDEWHNEGKFILWAFANGFDTSLTLDRRENDKGYSPDNCRWVDMSVQNANQRLIKKNNTSGYKGVSWHKKSQQWIVSISMYGKRKYLGTYDDPREAAQVRDDYIVKHNLPHAKNLG